MTKKGFSVEFLVKNGMMELSPGIWGKPHKSGKVGIFPQKPKIIVPAKPNSEIRASMPFKINVKPMSINEAFRGRRFISPKYAIFKKAVLAQLPKINMPKPPYSIYFKFGFSSKASDWDNAIKTAQDCLSVHYKFNDKLIRKGIVETEIVKKGQEYFIFSITAL